MDTDLIQVVFAGRKVPLTTLFYTAHFELDSKNRLVLVTEFRLSKYNPLRVVLHPFLRRNKIVHDVFKKDGRSMVVKHSDAFVPPIRQVYNLIFKNKKFDVIKNDQFVILYHQGSMSEIFIFKTPRCNLNPFEITNQAVNIYWGNKHQFEEDMKGVVWG